MIPGHKSYLRMKNPEIEWLGVVPEHWRVLPNRAIFSEVNDRGHAQEQMLAVTISKGVIPQQVLLKDSSKKDSSRLDRSGYKLVQPGDIAYNKMRAWQGALGVSDYRGIISPAYVVQRPRTNALARYLHYLFRTPAFAKEAERWSYGITSDMWSLRPEHFKMIYSCIPPLPEQAAIARFLDHMDHRIQKYIRAKEKLIALLDEYKQALIHQTVTGQIDVRTGEPYAEYKASGVEWFERLPTHWEMRKLKTVCRIRYGLGQPPPESEWGLPLIRATNVERGRIVEKGLVRVDPDEVPSSRDAVLQEGEIIVVRSGAYTADSAIVPNAFAGSIAGYDMVVTAIKARPDFVASALLSTYVRDEQLIVESMRAAQPHLNAEELGSALVALPPLTEQAVVVTYLKEKTGLIDANVNLMAHQCNVLAEYRARLIADIVTGKLDVRQAAARLPDIDPIGEANASGFTNRIDTLNLDEAATVA